MLSSGLVERMEEVIEDCMGDAPAPCVATCPLHIDAKGYIDLIDQGKYMEALKLIRETTPFPGILGRICAHPCEEECRRQEVETALSIKNLKRFVADFDDQEAWDLTTAAPTGKKVAIIGAGPAGAIAAYDLRKKGHEVTIYEKLPVVGGMLRVGIPAYRLPHEVIDKEYSVLEKLGVEIKLNTEIGKDVTLEELEAEFDSVFIATGAHKGVTLPLEGGDLEGVKSGVEILRKAGLEKFDEIDLEEKVVVIGGGNVAMDVARTAWRLGAEEVDVVCLECYTEMPAHSWEIEDAEEEGINMNPGWGPKEIVGEDKVEGIILKRCISVFDEEGNFDPSYKESENKEIKAGNIIFAIGQSAQSEFMQEKENIEVNRGGKISVDPVTLQSEEKHIFAGGDVAGRPLLAIEAMEHGRRAAESIDRFLKGKDLYEDREYEGSYETWLDKEVPEEEPQKERVDMPMLPVDERRNNFKEVELGFSREQAQKEAERCLQCECKDCVAECEFLDQYCEYPKEFMERLLEDPEDTLAISYFCNLCDTCTVYCPKDFELSDIFLNIRRELVEQDKGPLKEHVPVTKFHQPLGFSGIFTTRLGDRRTGKADRVFFPGCSLSSYAPEVVAGTYSYLQDNLDNVGFILKCCGAPTNMVGQEELFRERFGSLIDDVRSLGAREIITACPDCTHNILEHKPDDIEVVSIYEVLTDVGLPEISKGRAEGRTVSIHDSCTARHFEEMHESVRKLVREVGFDIEEFEHNREDTRCCGFGGMVLLANKDLSTDIMNRRAGETEREVVTYCAACRESMMMAEKPAYHLLELIFSDRWQQGARQPDNPLVQWINRWKTKRKAKSIG